VSCAQKFCFYGKFFKTGFSSASYGGYPSCRDGWGLKQALPGMQKVNLESWKVRDTCDHMQPRIQTDGEADFFLDL
jgi:hypothetical protein